MRKSIWLLGAAAFLALPALHAPFAQTKTGDGYVIIAQGVPGAPVGGATGTGGNSGVNDYGAGTDRAHTYDTPTNQAPAPDSPRSDDQNLRHRHHTNTNSNGLNKTTSGNNGTGHGDRPQSGNSY